MTKHFKKTFFCLIFLSGFLLWGNAMADTHTAASCSNTDVTSAITASSDGDTVAIPSGDCTWTAAVVIDKSITLQGSGYENTIITDGQEVGWNNVPLLFSVAGKTIRITGFTLKRHVTNKKDQGLIFVSTLLTSLRIDNMKFDDNDTPDTLRGRAIWINTPTPTLIDNNIFDTQAIEVTQTSDCVSTTSCAAWESPMAWGTPNAVYIENNTINFDTVSDGFVDCKDGGKYVVRYNTFTGYSGSGGHGFDSTVRGCMQEDYYNNTFTNDTGENVDVALKMRSATGVVYNNIITGYARPYTLKNVRSFEDNTSHPTLEMCDGSGTGASAYDGNTPPAETYRGYPCLDQPGRGTGQSLYPIYEWNNCKVMGCSNSDANDINVIFEIPWEGLNYQSTHIQENRDYYNNTVKPEYTAYTCPHPLAGTGSCDEGVAGTAGYSIDPDIIPPASPTGLSVN